MHTYLVIIVYVIIMAKNLLYRLLNNIVKYRSVYERNFGLIFSIDKSGSFFYST